MANLKIKNNLISEFFEIQAQPFPKYSTQIMNLANQNAGGTRPKVVGQMSDLITEFPGKTLEAWEKWYLEKHPNALADATEKTYSMIQNLQQVITSIDKEMVRRYLYDLLINKTFTGLKFQEIILEHVARHKNTNYSNSTPIEEAKGIDGYIGAVPVSIKPTSYKTKNLLNEVIEVSFIFYEKTKTGLSIEFYF